MLPPQNIFRAYDIRGIYGSDLDAEGAFLIGRGFASFLINNLKIKKPKVVVGRDGRTHSPILQKEFISGLVKSGCHVTDLGLAPTPYLYFANTAGKFDAGCNITASHNPKEHNGFKLIRENAHAIYGEDLQTIWKIIERNEFVDGKGKATEGDWKKDYQEKISSFLKPEKPLKIVVDTANGVAGTLYPEILKSLGYDVVNLYTDLDGSFPNHEPDPIVEKNLDMLKVKVVEYKADLGIAFDGDGDRMSLVTEKGEFINADKTLMLLAKDALSRHPGRTVVFTVSCSQVLFDLISEWGGKPHMCKVGHSYVEHAMSELNAILGGEQSGHYFMPEDYFTYDDALITASRLLKIFSSNSTPVSKVFDQFPRTYALAELRPNCPDNIKFRLINEVVEHFCKQFKCITLDGVRIDFGNGTWAGIRASNTSPKISVIVEALSQESMERHRDLILDYLKKFPEIEWH